jgi:hypothetical protein
MTRLSVGRLHPMRARNSAATTSTALITRNRVAGITIRSVSSAHSCQPVKYSSVAWRAHDAATIQSVHSLVVLRGIVTSPPSLTDKASGVRPTTGYPASRSITLAISAVSCESQDTYVISVYLVESSFW